MNLGERLSSCLKSYYRKHLVETQAAVANPKELCSDNSVTSQLLVPSLRVPAVGWDDERLVSLTPSQVLLPLIGDSEKNSTFHSGAKILYLSDDQEVAASKETLLNDILRDWCRDENVRQHEGLWCFELVIAIEAKSLVRDGIWKYLRRLVPDAYHKFGDKAIKECITKSRVLFLVNNWPDSRVSLSAYELSFDTVDKKRELQKSVLAFFAAEMPLSRFLISIHHTCLSEWLKILQIELKVSALFARLTSQLKTPDLLLDSKHREIVKWCTASLWKEDCIKHWPRCRQSQILRLFSHNDILYSSRSKCDLVWSMLTIQLHLFQEYTSCSLDACDILFSSLCNLAYDSQFGRTSVNQHFERINLAPKLKDKFLRYFLLILPKFAPATTDYYVSFMNELQSHVLVSWHVYRNKLSIASSLGESPCRDQVAAMFIGHMRRDVEKNTLLLENKTLHRELKSLYLLSEKSNDPQSYLLQLLSEIHDCDPLVKILFENAVFPRQLELFEDCLIKDPLLIYMKVVQPRRVLLLVRCGKESQELLSIVDEIRQLDLSFGLGLMHHLEPGNLDTSDAIVSSALTGSKARLQDLLGCLTFPVIEKLTPESASHLTCLRVRVNSQLDLRKIFTVQSTLPNLMWFEIDFDLPLENFTNTLLQKIKTPLCDLTFYGLKNCDVGALVKFLEGIRESYLSGLHLRNSTLDVISTITLVQELKKVDIVLSTPPETINVYRRWRYSELSVLGNNEMMDEVKVLTLLGYDDRHQYSDNEVRTSVAATESDIENLSEYLNENEDLTYFKFGSPYAIVTKLSNKDIVRTLIQAEQKLTN
ncbi:uncharacterized protein LOC108666474 [Hyalella azteca]|uniref:Uncharacterized protein LOC108666474 n=1 Tax=Hyalella azteca TaxID=294128 RepID=A0A8B7N4S3_HYAAZ|nr:uncharacterized protein LOC108666474 [Hyalella azteca]